MNDFSRRIADLPHKRLVLLATQLQSRLERLERNRQEPIAVIGMGCRFPGGVSDPESFWKILRNGEDAVGEIPEHRLNVADYYDSDVHAPGKITTRWAGLIDHVDRFDASFFGIAPREAHTMDPQQRILLETSWEALERAGISTDRLFGSQTGVFIGISGSDYYHLQLSAGNSNIDAYFASGNAHSVASGRLAYVLGLQGPCLSVDTACSSSLVAVHLAVQSLRNQECDAALAGGVNLILSPETTIALSKAEMMSPDGRCKAFDARANGFVRGEGCGILVLKRLSDAMAQKDHILALIKGSAINQDGKSNGLTAPNGPSQEAVISMALANSGVKPQEIGYVEAHGTGTALGDPIEARALGAVFNQDRSQDNALWVGSVKTNIGHLEAAAGIAGLIKAILALQNMEIPAHLHFERLNPHIDSEHLPFKIPTQTIHWPSGPARRRAGVSSFGFSGTNAHVILEEAPATEEEQKNVDRPLHILTLSAKSPEALKEQAAHVTSFLSTTPASFADICYSANVGRTHFNQRLAVVAQSGPEAAAELKSWSESTSGKNVRYGEARRQKGAEVAFLFTGQGSQYTDMGKKLYETYPRFREVLDRCDEQLKPYLGHSLISLIHPAKEDSAGAAQLLNQTRFTQPVLFALEYAVADTWRSWGIEPTVVMGHSLGEYAAACFAGHFSLEDGIRLVCERARLMQELSGAGAMAAVFEDLPTVEKMLASYGNQLSFAAHNGPSNTVVSGAAADMTAFCRQLEAAGIGFSNLNVSHAFHSILMEPMLAEFERTVASIDCHPHDIPIVSNVTGELAGLEVLSDPTYWCRHTRQPVQFDASIRMLHQQMGCKVFIEVGPHPVLCGMGSRIIASNDLLWLPSLRKGQDDWRQMLTSAAELHVRGHRLDWMGFDKPWPRRKIVLPTYPFERKHYWSGVNPAVAGYSDSGDTEPWRKWLHQYSWKALSKISAGIQAPDYLPAPDVIAQKVQSQVKDLILETGIDIYDEFLPRLENLCSVYVVKAFERLGWQFAIGNQFNSAAMAKHLRILDKHQRLFERMLTMLAEDKILERYGSDWQVISEPEKGADPVVLLNVLKDQYPRCSAELALIGGCAGQLAEVMTGKLDPMTLLFPNGSMALLEKMYQSSPVLQFFNSLIKFAFSLAAGSLPSGRRLRILEIGAGTGGTTGFVLPELSGKQPHFAYTDVSEAFLAQARQKFQEYPFIDFRLLDIAEDPQAQGFPDGQFDIVLAANVLHATQDMRKTLHHVRRLIAPDGLLILLEGINYQRFSDLTVGLTWGWWHFTDEELRPSYALMPASKWRQLMPECGFDQVAVLPADPPEHNSVLSQQAVIIARASRPAAIQMEAYRAKPDTQWMVFCDDAGIGRHLVSRLQVDGHHCISVVKGDGYAQIDPQSYAVNPFVADNFVRLMRQTVDSESNPIQKIIYLWGIDESFDAGMAAEEFEIKQHRMCGSLLFLIQAIAGSMRSAALSVVTQGVQAVVPEDKISGLAQSSLWGLGRVIALEHPEFECLRIDIDDQASEADVSMLMEILTNPERLDTQIAIRGGQSYALRVVQSDRPGPGGIDRSESLSFRPDAAYLVTGGLGGLGLEVARWMVGRGARKLLLMGRSAPSDAAAAMIAKIEQAGAEVVVIQGDVAEYDNCVKVFDRIAQEQSLLRGIIHSAGFLDDGILLQQNWERFRKVMRAKVDGSWNLHLLSKDLDLDFFVLFSSGAAFLGSSGQGNHATANAFMDALAHYRQACGLPAVSINWGAWDKIGAATKGDVIHRMQIKGMGLIQPQQGLSVLGQLISRPSPQIAVLPIIWPDLFDVFEDNAERSVFEAFETRAEPKRAGTKKTGPVLLARLQKSTPGKRYEILLESVQEVICKCLGLDLDQSIDASQPLTEMGLDSLMAVELRNTISVMVDSPLPATLLFNYPSMGELVRFLAGRVLTADMVTVDEPSEQPTGAGKGTEVDDIDSYSEEEMERLLKEQLKDI